jgi:polyphosphate kinase 2
MGKSAKHERAARAAPSNPLTDPDSSRKQRRKFYEHELSQLHIELIRLQEHVRRAGARIVVLFEGRDAAGKGGVIKRIMEPLNPRICRVVALGTPTERQKTQWYFQRYAEELPAAGEIVLFDRSWYNRAGVERVMGFCSNDQYWEFLRSAPLFERMLVRDGIVLIKYWFSVSDAVQEARFRARVADPVKRWKLSPMDLESRNRWQEYSRAKDRMLSHTDSPEAPWYVIDSNDKKRARLNCIAHLLSLIPHEEPIPDAIDLPPRPIERRHPDDTRPCFERQHFVPERY